MQKSKIIMLTIFFVILGASGCRWQDDFRAREQPYYLQQPQYIEPTPRPTLNKDSDDYLGNDLNKKEHDEKATQMPSIDGLSKIPELPEYPAGVEVR